MTAEISQDLIFACTEGASGAPLDADVLVDASPAALSWAPNSRRAYTAG